jgi:hypothetical protein
MITPLPRLPQHRREWLTEASTCRYEDLQMLLANYDAVPALAALLMDAQHDMAKLMAAQLHRDECEAYESATHRTFCKCAECAELDIEHVEPREPDERDRDGDYLGSEDVRRLR